MGIFWIKVVTDLFSNHKIKYIRSLPKGDSLALLWIGLLTVAGRCNADGRIYLTPQIPYSEKTLSDELRFPVATIRVALKIFAELDMIEVDEGFITVLGWQEYQNIQGMEKVREQGRLRQKKYREKKKMEGNVTLTQDNATDEEVDKDGDLDIDDSDYQYIMDSYHELCTSLPAVKMLTESRKMAIRDCLHTHSINEIRQAFEKTEASPFLKGSNESGWKANFDWIIKPDHLIKILEGFYDGRVKSSKENVGPRELDQDEVLAIKRMMRE